MYEKCKKKKRERVTVAIVSCKNEESGLKKKEIEIKIQSVGTVSRRSL